MSVKHNYLPAAPHILLGTYQGINRGTFQDPQLVSLISFHSKLPTVESIKLIFCQANAQIGFDYECQDKKSQRQFLSRTLHS